MIIPDSFNKLFIGLKSFKLVSIYYWLKKPHNLTTFCTISGLNIIMLITGITVVWTWFKVDSLAVKTNIIEQQINNIQEHLNTNEASATLTEYFTNIELGKHEDAWNLFSENKKAQHPSGLIGFKEWLEYLVSFEGLQIKELPEKRSAATKAFIAEFDLKKRGMKPVYSIYGFYVKFNGEKWLIDYSNVLYENGWKKGACEFYSGFDICNPTQ
jgi:predicted nucleotide-binding protein (sugar kinase/HSP70/actin superfamily)